MFTRKDVADADEVERAIERAQRDARAIYERFGNQQKRTLTLKVPAKKNDEDEHRG